MKIQTRRTMPCRISAKALHRTFNGEPGDFAATQGLMYALELQAQQLMQTPSGRNDGTTAGPSFQLQFPL